jgi:CRP/FNR family transcriptional regulator, dissimilatory nitrate respiration regulator
LDHMETTASAKLDWKEAERRLPFLAALPVSARPSIHVEEVNAGQLLFQAGATPTSMFFVLSGEVRLMRSSRSGGEIVLQRARRGILAEASLDQGAYHCDAVASVPSTVLSVPRHTVRQALKEERFASAWRNELSRELRRLRAQCERLSLKGAPDRIIHYLETEGERGAVTLTQTKKQWAAELGLTHEALYRTLAEMRNSGAIRIDGRKIRLTREHPQRG